MALSVFAAAREAPDRPALVTDGGTLTWRELAERVRPVVATLRERGLDGDAPVAVVAANDVPTLLTLHALLALGTPALLLHPRLTPAERVALAALGAEAGAGPAPPLEPARDPELADAAPAAGPARAVGAVEGADDRAAPDDGAADPPVPPDDERALAIVHTSGTSGRPKGVVLSRRAFAASARASAANLGWRDDDRWLLPLPLAHVGGLSIVTRCLLARRPVVLAPGVEPEPLLDALRRHRVTLLSLVPTVLKRVLDLDPAPRPPDRLRAVLLGGAAASPALLERAADLGWPVLTTYGLTEACSQVTTQRYGTVNRGKDGSGPPLPGIELRIADDDAIQLRGPTLLSGYLPAHPGGPFLEGGWLATGDHGRLDDRGNLHVLGRRTDRIVTGGENVDPVEVEQALEGLPAVREACVFGVPDEEWGQVVCAAVVPSAGAADGPEGVATAVRGLRGRIAAFKLPRRVALVDSLPRNTTGKVDRAETARRAARHLRPLP